MMDKAAFTQTAWRDQSDIPAVYDVLYKRLCVLFAVAEIMFVNVPSYEERVEYLVSKDQSIIFIANIIIIFIIKIVLMPYSYHFL